MEVQASNLPKSQSLPNISTKILNTEAEITKTNLEIKNQVKTAEIKPSNFECKFLTCELQSQIEKQRSLKEELKEAKKLIERFKAAPDISEIFKIQRLNKSLKSIRVKKKRTYYWKIFELASLYLVRLLENLRSFITLACYINLKKKNFILCYNFRFTLNSFWFDFKKISKKFLKNILIFQKSNFPLVE